MQAAESRLEIAATPRTKDLDLERFAKPYTRMWDPESRFRATVAYA